jgi:hypothetical protein
LTLHIAGDRSRLQIRDAHVPPGTPLTLLLSGRRIWSFEVPESEGLSRSHFSVEWPPALAERLTGRATLSLERDGKVLSEASIIRFDEADVDFDLIEPLSGAHLTVNKWGRLAQPFDSRTGNILEELLDETEHLIALMSSLLDIDLFVTGGTLLGPVRDGAILPHDDDVDLAYLSRYDNPSDIAQESFEIERALVAIGYEINRHSSAHIQLMFPGHSLENRFYIDIFTYFQCNGWFYGPFHARQRAELVTVLPLASLNVNGRQLPSPADPAEMLAAIYGPTWRVPNPAFRFLTPPAAARRFFWWFNHFDVDRENWEDRHRALMNASPPPAISDFAIYTETQLSAGGTVIDLGCGLGTDSHHFADRGHGVIAADYSRPALLHGMSRPTGSVTPSFHHVNFNMVRHTARLRALVAKSPGPHYIYARRLFNALPPLGWDVTLQFIRSVLRAEESSRAFIEIDTEDTDDASKWTDFRGVEWHRMQTQLRRYDLTIESTDASHADNEQTAVRWMVVRADQGD